MNNDSKLHNLLVCVYNQYVSMYDSLKIGDTVKYDYKQYVVLGNNHIASIYQYLHFHISTVNINN